MRRKKLLFSKMLASFLMMSICALSVPVGNFAQIPQPTSDGVLTGNIYDLDMKTPVRNVVVKLQNVVSEKLYESEPTNPLGQYQITAIEEGRYLMGVQTLDGAYNFQYSIYLKGTETARLSVALGPRGFSPPQDTGGAAGTDKPKGFFASPMGILTLIVVAEAVLFAVVLIEKEASPIR